MLARRRSARHRICQSGFASGYYRPYDSAGPVSCGLAQRSMVFDGGAAVGDGAGAARPRIGNLQRGG